MKWMLYYRLWQIRRAALPSQAYSARLEKDLKKRTGYVLGWVPLGRIVAGITSFSVLVSGATGVYAYSSDAVTAEHPLYRVRSILEQVELKTTFREKNREIILQKHRQRQERSMNRPQR